jgi:hypothetical protein
MYGPFFLVFAVMALFVIVGIVQARASAERREALREFAEREGLQMTVAQGSGCLAGGMFAADSACPEPATMFGEFQPFGVGYARRTDNVLVGERNGRTYYLFDYRYTTGGGRSSQTHCWGMAAVRVPFTFPGLDIRPEGFLDRIGQAIGFKDLQFGFEEFDRRYHVKAFDEGFARALIDQRMMEFLLRVQARHWQLGGFYLLVCRSGYYSPAELDEVVREMDGFLDAIPDAVRQAVAFQPNWNSPWA